MPKKLPIITNPNPILRKKSEDIKIDLITGQELKEFIADMAKTMIEDDGVGLAAPQVGKNIRLVLINTKNGVLAVFNPKILKKSWRQEWGEEGCLSVPKIFGLVKRHRKIKYEYHDADGKPVCAEASGFMARVLQHEIDHLNGVLFIDKAKNLKTLKKI